VYGNRNDYALHDRRRPLRPDDDPVAGGLPPMDGFASSMNVISVAIVNFIGRVFFCESVLVSVFVLSPKTWKPELRRLQVKVEA